MLAPHPLAFAALSLLPWPATPPPDEGYDLLLLEMPHRVVIGDNLDFAVRGRPGNLFTVLADLGNTQRRFGRVRIHLDLSPALTQVALGIMPASGSSAFSVPVVNDPALVGLVVYFQAFARDTSALGGWVASDGKTLTVHDEQGEPLIRLLTVNDIPRDQNGSETAEGTLNVPPMGFTVDLTFDDRGQGPIDAASLVVTADQPLGGGSIPAGTDLSQFFVFNGNRASGLVHSQWAFPTDTDVTLTATIANQNGVVSPAETYKVHCEAFTPQTQPFATKHHWLLEFDRHDLDLDGIPDFREDLVTFGLGNDPTETSGPSANVDAQVRAAIQAQLRANFGVGTPDAVNVDFVLLSPGGLFATICVGGRSNFPIGSLPPGAQETTGAALLNPRNQIKNISNCDNGVVSTGVFPRSVFFLFRNVPAFQLVFGPLLATPVGTDPDDAVVTAPGYVPGTGTPQQDARYQVIRAGIVAFAQSVGFVLTQECGHSMGLVPASRLGLGLLGGTDFGHSTQAHFDDGLGNFMSGNNSTPAPAQPANLALVWDHMTSGRAHFTPLNWAYLRERVIH